MWRKRGKGEGLSTRFHNNKSLLSESCLSPYHQQKTGLFRNTMIAPATVGARHGDRPLTAQVRGSPRHGDRPLTAQVRGSPRHGDRPFVFPSAPLRCGQRFSPQGSWFPDPRPFSPNQPTNQPTNQLVPGPPGSTEASTPTTAHQRGSASRLTPHASLFRFAADKGSVPKAPADAGPPHTSLSRPLAPGP